jgi:DNA-binding response OmpR family regulator
MMTRRKCILVLGIDEQLLIDLERLLENRGFATTTTWDTDEALHLVQSHRFDLLLIGDHPPQVAASEVLRQVQSGRTSVPCIILQQKSAPFSEEYFYSLGAAGVVTSREPGEIDRQIQGWFSADRVAVAG